MTIPTLPGITARTVTTPRLTTRVLFSGPEQGVPLLLLHGNTTSATWLEEVMLSLPDNIRAIAPDQRGFGDADPAAKIDATRGVGDLVDDAIALLDELAIDRAHIFGHSLGGAVVWGILREHPQRFLSVVLVAPGSPYGFGGTKGLDGVPCYDDFAGSGGGLANPELIQRLQDKDMSLESQFSPRAALRSLLVRPGFIPEREDDLVASMCAMHIGPQDNPGGASASTNWPFAAPGEWGAANMLSPKYAGDVSALYRIEPKPPILWLRGADDLVVSDTALSDPGYLGMLGFIPGWPGAEVFPPQPMLGQTRRVLENYADAGGQFEEVVIPGAGHTPYLDQAGSFNEILHRWLDEPEQLT
jgi:pimeloyl-ACP methyl ester carboxylesterase